jgi:hypothetical protein
MAIGISTVILFFSYTMFIFGFAAASEEETAFAGGLIGIATGLVPAVFGVLAAVSQRPHSIRTALLATLLWFAVGGPIAILDIPSGLAAGFGAGGVVALRRDPANTVNSRVAAVVVCVVYVFVLGRIIPAAALMVGGVLPFLAVGVADSITEREAAAAESESESEDEQPSNSAT